MRLSRFLTARASAVAVRSGKLAMLSLSADQTFSVGLSTVWLTSATAGTRSANTLSRFVQAACLGAHAAGVGLQDHGVAGRSPHLADEAPQLLWMDLNLRCHNPFLS
jgi:hypothetical protein